MTTTAAYRVPPVTVSLGTVLDVRFEFGGVRVYVDDWHGWQLLTDEGAFESSRPRLWLVPGKPERVEREGPQRARRAYERWHKREAEYVGELDVPTGPLGYRQGRVLAIGYRSDKWGRRGQSHDYDHDFTEGEPPLLYTDRADVERARGAVIVGGDMRVTARGID